MKNHYIPCQGSLFFYCLHFIGKHEIGHKTQIKNIVNQISFASSQRANYLLEELIHSSLTQSYKNPSSFNW